jgi:hypothetical protein
MNKLFTFYFLLFTLFISLLLAETIEIKQDGTGNFTTIQEGIDASTDSDTVLVYPGTYYENLNMNGKNITLASLELITREEAYIDSTIIDGQRLESCIRVHNGETDAHIQGFTIQNGFGTLFWSEDGGGVLVHDYSTAYISNCIIKKNIATLGAGIYARHGFLYVSGLNIFDNSAGFGGAIYMADDSTINFDNENLCNIYNNNAGKGADLFVMDTGHINVIVDTFSVLEPSRYFAESIEGSSYTFDIQNNWMELVAHDLYVAVDGDDNNSGLTPEEPLKNISWAVRKIYADEQNPRIVHVASGTYSNEINQQIYPIGCKEYVSVIGEDMEDTILFNDFITVAIIGDHLNGFTEISDFSIRNSSEMYTLSVIFCYEVNILKLSNIKIQDNSNIKKIFVNEYVYNEYANLIITDNVTDGTNSGLGLYKNSGYMKNSIIANNENIEPNPYSPEVAMQLAADGDFLLENCVFSGNHSTNLNGRILRTTNCNGNEPTITFNNCLISDNSIGSRYVFQNFNYDGLTEFNNCTFSNNTASSSFYPTTLYSYGDINMTNTIMHDNTNYEIFMVDDTQYGYIYELNLDYCNIKNGEDGVYNMNNVNIINWLEGNIDEDPQFIGTGDHPYQLTELSPCVDTGTPDTTGLSLPPWDLLHNHRVWDGDNNGTVIIDMGCYEFGAEPYVGISNNELPISNFELRNYPNPFNPETKIVFNLPEEGNIKLEIYNIRGQKVKTLLDCYMSPGCSEMIWNGKDDNGKAVGSGIYFYKLQTPAKSYVRKCMLLK